MIVRRRFSGVNPIIGAKIFPSRGGNGGGNPSISCYSVFGVGCSAPPRSLATLSHLMGGRHAGFHVPRFVKNTCAGLSCASPKHPQSVFFISGAAFLMIVGEF
jgi:hypothetical protein